MIRGSRLLRVARCVLAAAGMTLASIAAAAAVPVETWRAFREEPSIARAAEPDQAIAVGVAAPGGGWAVAFPLDAGEKRARSSLRARTPDAPEGVDLEIPGTVLALLFSPEGDSLYAAIRRPAVSKRAEPEVYLATIDLVTLQARRRLRLPTTTADLAWARNGEVLLIACRDEIRSLSRSDLRSGPLFPVPGDNRAILADDGSALIVGQADRWIAVDLEDRPDERSLPIRGAGMLDSPALAVRRADEGVWILTEDASIVRVGPAPPANRPVAPPPALQRPESEPSEIYDEPQERDPALEVPAASPDSAPTGTEAPEDRDAVGEASPERPTALEEPPEPVATPLDPAPSNDDSSDRVVNLPTDAQLTGRLVGPSASSIREIVVSGPNNLLRIARRIIPDANGVWRVDGLEAGRYRLQADAGGDARAVTSPPFLVIELPADGEPLRLPDWSVLRID